ncbi:hypothetical protein [Labilithrix luteola]|uniref:hypothetical protein n=1 Tax=Labilithrix luteola TaxID=1391654 RepID=UPI0011BA4E8D|nr:hypothetical protein [Labilithrix luteola]
MDIQTGGGTRNDRSPGDDRYASAGSLVMLDSDFQIRQARIDVPLRSTFAYLFVTPDMAKWDPWWLQLFNYLTSLAPAELQWQLGPAENVYVMRPELSDVQRSELAAFLRSAPPHQIEEHRTLRLAVGRLSGEQVRKLRLVFFSVGMEPLSREDRDPSTGR